MRVVIKKTAAGHAAAAGHAIAGQTQVADAELVRIVHEDFENDGMQVQVEMAVDVVERQASGMEFLKLRMDFGAELFAQIVVKKISHSGADRAVGKFPTRVDEAGYGFIKQGGVAVKERNMQANAEFWVFFGQPDGFVKTGFVHHQACRCQNAFAMRAHNSYVDGRREAKVIGIDDEAAGGGGLRVGSAHSTGCRIWPRPRRNRTATTIGKSAPIFAL